MKFELDTDEKKIYDEWYRQHLEDAHGNAEPYAGAVGGRISFVVTPTSIGTFVSVECTMCKRTRLAEEVTKAAIDSLSAEKSGFGKCLTDTSDW